MLHILKGERNKVLKESDVLLKKLFKEDPELNYEKLDEENWSLERVKELTESQSLFGNRSAAVIDETEDVVEELGEILDALKESNNIFIIRRTEEVKGKKDYFNIFAFTDTVASRNKKQAWIMYQKALASGMAPEEVYWKVVWQVRTMLLAERCASAQEAGLNPFVYQKAKSGLKNFKPGEVEKLSEQLVVGYHNARRGIGEIETLVEKLLLRL